MKPAPFDYVRVESVASCIRELGEAGGEGKIIAGGQSLVPVLAMRLSRPSVLVDIGRIPGLARIDRHDGLLEVGAMARHADLLDQRESPLLAEAARWIGHAAIRSRGTIGGSLAHADPAAEWPVVATALGATVSIAGPSGRRGVGASDFFLGPLEPDLAPDEIVVSVTLPVPERWGFAEFSRRHGDFGLVTVVTTLVQGRWRVVIGGVAGVPAVAEEAGAILSDSTGANAVVEAARAAAASVAPSGDVHGSTEYRRAMVEVFASRAIAQAVAPYPAGVS